MLSKNSIHLASQLAAGLTERGIVLAPRGNSATPLSILLSHVTTYDLDGDVALTDEVMAMINTQVLEGNSAFESDDNAEHAERRDLIANITQGNRATLITLREKLIPLTKQIVDQVIARCDSAPMPSAGVSFYKLPAMFQDASLLGELETKARRSGIRGGERISLSTLRLGSLSDIDVNAIVGDDTVLAMAEAPVSVVASTLHEKLFVQRSEWPINDLGLGSPHQRFLRISWLFAIYQMATYYAENPSEASRVSLDEWTTTFDHLANQMAWLILDTLQVFQQYLHQQRLIVHTENADSVNESSVVHLFSPVFDTLKAHGDVSWLDRLFSTLTISPGSVYVKEFLTEEQGGSLTDETCAKAMAKWEGKQMAARARHLQLIRSRKQTYLIEETYAAVKDQADDEGSIFEDIRAFYKAQSHELIENVWSASMECLLTTLFQAPVYRQFLSTMEHNRGRSSSIRETALLTNVDFLAGWWRQQLTYEDVAYEGDD